jgi:hypothetical protein
MFQWGTSIWGGVCWAQVMEGCALEWEQSYRLSLELHASLTT